MTIRQSLSLILLLAAGCLAVAAAWAQQPSAAAPAAPTPLPYQVISGQVVSSEFMVVCVLDVEAKRLAVLRYDWTKKLLVPIAGRLLTRDFNSEGGGPYSVVSTQLTNQRGLLFVTDFTSRRAIVYEVNLLTNKVTPQQPFDLKQLFSDTPPAGTP